MYEVLPEGNPQGMLQLLPRGASEDLAGAVTVRATLRVLTRPDARVWPANGRYWTEYCLEDAVVAPEHIWPGQTGAPMGE